VRWKRSSSATIAVIATISLIGGACSGRGEAVSGTARPVVTTPSGLENKGERDAGADAADGGGGVSALPPPACDEVLAATPGPWGRAVEGSAGIARAMVSGDERTLGGFAQQLAGRGDTRLRFLGTHVFDLLDKVASEGGASEAERRRTICAVLNEAAKSGAPVVRIWGSLKRTGSTQELERAREMLALVLDEDARRARPLRFVVSLLNHQPGYGLPDPEGSLDDQKAPGWSAREVYMEGSWKRRGIGQLAERIEKYREDVTIRTSPNVLAWELVNELDTHRSVARGSFAGAEADKLVTTFLVPAAEMLASSFPQPIVLGDLRGALKPYPAFAERVAAALPEVARRRLVWTTHVYVETTSPPPSASEAKALVESGTRKLDLDLEVARKLRVPLLLGEIGQLVRGAKTTYCGGGATHDVPGLLGAVLSPEVDPHGRRDIDAAVFWGEGMCGLVVGEGQSGRRVSIGAGGDSADLGPGEADARRALTEARGQGRFVVR
jgi:hypothetical protein